MYIHVCKPIFGSLIAGISLIILSPLLLIISVLLVISTKESPFFLQTRIGHRQKPFKIIKFKTMFDRCDENGRLLPDDQRTFPLGRILRNFSLDELPQLINILKGDMAFVGPRPWIPSQMEALPHSFRKRRCSVRPGITGLAQLNGRNGISFNSRVCYDAIYIRRISLQLDLFLMFKTVRKILIREGIQQCSDAFQDKQGRILLANDPSLPSSAKTL